MAQTSESKRLSPAALELGRYELHGVIASGGMASVHLGRMRTAAGVTRTVAIKRMHPHFLEEPDFASMFLDEARLAMRIVHPNVVGTFDVISTQTELLLVMDFVLGESLYGLLRAARRAGGTPPVPVVCGILIGVLAGLHAAHEATDEDGAPLGIVHRDVSPQNVLVGVDGLARVLDFGIAKAAGRLHSTQDGRVKGKLAYMAPEQLAQGSLDRRVDVFAAAAVLWEGLTGLRLFDAESPGAIVANVLDKAIVAPSTINPDVPEAVDAIVLRGLSRHPDGRFASAREMAADLERACAPATAREIGEWVAREAEEIVQARTALLANVESRSSSGVKSPPEQRPERSSQAPANPAVGAAWPSASTEGTDATRTTSSIAEAPSRPSTGRRVPVRWALAAIGVTCVLFLPVVLSRVSARRNDRPDAAIREDRRAVTSASATPSPTATAAPDSASAAAPEAPITPATTTRADHPPIARPPVPRKPDCRNPFTIGSGGIRVPRPECF